MSRGPAVGLLCPAGELDVDAAAAAAAGGLPAGRHASRNDALDLEAAVAADRDSPHTHTGPGQPNLLPGDISPPGVCPIGLYRREIHGPKVYLLIP